MRALLCPASLKGVLTAEAAAAALARGVRGAGGDAVELPIADGGEGTGAALHAVLGGDWREAVVSDPLGRPIPARWLVLPDGVAVIEAAAAIGLPLLAPGERDPLVASSRGLGELIAAALREKPTSIIVGLGGSATVDGGAGLREVLRALPVPTTALCDVHTTLADAARLFGPQKGATPEMLPVLKWRLGDMDELRPYADLSGAGAAGGLGAALAALGAELVAGAVAVLDLVGFDVQLAGCDLAVTGEGQVDRTTAEGKAPGEVARRCAVADVRCIVFGGRVVEPVAGTETVSLSGNRAQAAADLEQLGMRLLSAVGIAATRPRSGRLQGLRDRISALTEFRSCGHRDSARASRSAMASSIFQATAGLDSTNGRKTNTGRPYAFTSVAAVTVAVRGRRSISAISPKAEPGPIVDTGSPCTSTESSPLSTTKNMRPPSPSSAILSPGENRRSLNSSARLSRSRSSRSEKRRTLRRSAGVGLDMRRFIHESRASCHVPAAGGTSSSTWSSAWRRRATHSA